MADERLSCSETSCHVLTGEIPGGSTTLFDYFWDVESGQWIPWSDKVPEYVHISDHKFHKILVPTVDTVRTTWLLSLHVRYVTWRGGATVGRWTSDQEVVGSIPGSGRSCITTVGKSLTPACPAPLKLRPYGTIQISILLLLLLLLVFCD